MHVLLVEDDPLIGLNTAEELRCAGHRVSGPADNEAEAEALVQQEKPDLALVDINLAGDQEGVRLARRLHNRFGVRCLFVTGEAGPARANSDVAVGLLQKPYDPADLVTCVRLLEGEEKSFAPPNLELFGR